MYFLTQLVALLLSSGALGAPSAPILHRRATSPAEQKAYLDAHNSNRTLHRAKPLAWDDKLEAAAQTWANGCKFEHSGGKVGPFGENLAAGTGDGFGIAEAVLSWTNEAPQFDPKNPQFSHFTQVVWKGTSKLGCAKADCTGIFGPEFGLAHFHVCEYDPPGNVIGQFAENVQV